MLRGLDLFSGIGGITLALSPWVTPVAYCECEAYAQQVLAERIADGSLPKAPVFPDVCRLTAEDVGEVDIVYGGFPCQDVSSIGTGRGLDGERSGLVFELLRLAEETRCRYVFLENVAVLRRRGLDRVAGRLAEMGFVSRWCTVPATLAGAPHRRERMFILARRGDCGDPERPVADAAGARREGRGLGASDADTGRDACEARRRRPADGGGAGGASGGAGGPTGPRGPRAPGGRWPPEPSMGRVGYGIPSRTHRLRALGNAVVPAQAQAAFRLLVGLDE